MLASVNITLKILLFQITLHRPWGGIWIQQLLYNEIENQVTRFKCSEISHDYITKSKFNLKNLQRVSHLIKYTLACILFSNNLFRLKLSVLCIFYYNFEILPVSVNCKFSAFFFICFFNFFALDFYSVLLTSFVPFQFSSALSRDARR